MIDLADALDGHLKLRLDSAADLVGTKATSANVYILGRTVNDSLNSSYVSLPSSVGSSVRVRNLNTEGNTLTADITFCHFKDTSRHVNKHRIYNFTFLNTHNMSYFIIY